MAVRPVLIKRPPAAVWSVLSDGHRYADWVVGTHDSEPLDADWPAVGTAIRYTVKIGCKRLAGRTVVRYLDPVRRLELEAQSKLVGTARIGIELEPWGETSTLVTVDEHPLTGPGGRMHNTVSEALLQLRHRRMLRHLADVVEAATADEPTGR
ncbi:SRPBCC family protein [Streptomyces sp. SBT349]|uniref:SRPBCC family protein n=1 Tax=Streptomyces sp. SBT349 TaxID=1580539 RepID=UPI00066A2225|nr:SRPBCC family protein [Streptomyces sp. SBT349]